MCRAHIHSSAEGGAPRNCTHGEGQAGSVRTTGAGAADETEKNWLEDLLDIESEISEHDKVSVTFSHRILREGTLLVEGYCRLAGVNSAGKPTRLPARLLELIQ